MKKIRSTQKSYSDSAIKRIVADLATFHESPPPGLFLHSDEEDIGKMVALIIGPEGTPYEDGFFFFEIVMPEDYPFSPPAVEIRTTNNDKFRFNPNFYLEGKVCLSILGTWDGPRWTPVMNIIYTLVSIQTRMNEYPLANEPGWENSPIKQKEGYNDAIRELVLRSSVLDQLSYVHGFPKTKLAKPLSFEVFRPTIEEHFLKRFDNYFSSIQKIPRELKSRFQGYSRIADITALLTGFDVLRIKLESKLNSDSNASTSSSPKAVSLASSSSSHSTTSPIGLTAMTTSEAKEGSSITRTTSMSEAKERKDSSLSTRLKIILPRKVNSNKASFP